MSCVPLHEASFEAVPEKFDETDKDDHDYEDDANADRPMCLVQSIFRCFLLSLRPVKYLLREVLHPLCKEKTKEKIKENAKKKTMETMKEKGPISF